MTEPARLNVTLPCPSIEVRRGEYVTVWLRIDDGTDFNRIQCEIRVSRDGKPEVFLPGDHLGIMQRFEDWTPESPSPTPASAPDTQKENEHA
jgi:hypothetical protein